MAESCGFVQMVVALLALLHLTAATQFIVGGEGGWKESVDYVEWSASKTFRVRDTLLFPYTQGAHDVVEVGKDGYDGCNASSPIAQYRDGNTVITLEKEGQRWFISSLPQQCNTGRMRLGVPIIAANATVPALPASPPANSSAPPSPPAPVSPPPPPPSPSNSPSPSPDGAPSASPDASPAPSPQAPPSPPAPPAPYAGNYGPQSSPELTPEDEDTHNGAGGITVSAVALVLAALAFV